MVSSSIFPSVLSPNDVLALGLEIGAGLDTEHQQGMSKDARLLSFHAHYGSNPLDMADIWHDLQVGEYEGASLTEKEKSLKGFRMFLMATFYLWAKPKSSMLLATRFGVCERYCRGKHLWKWVNKVAALAEKKIRWDEKLSKPDTELFVASVDCVDFQYQ